jgi:hypothetical protein
MVGRLAGAVLAALISLSCGNDPAAVLNGPTSSGCSLPPAPANLRVTSMMGNIVELSWNAVPGATSYSLMVGSMPGSSDALFQDTVQTSFRFTSRDGRSFARVQANNACGGGPATGSMEFFVPG